MYNHFGVMVIIPISILLTISFFVLFTLQKVEKASIRNFGWAVTILLWIAAAVLLGAGTFVLSMGHGPMRGIHGMMMYGPNAWLGQIVPKGTVTESHPATGTQPSPPTGEKK